MKSKTMSLKDMAAAKQDPQMDLSPIHAALGDKTPPGITPDAVGRLRLVTALRNRFGVSYRNHPEAYRALSHFDSELSYFQTLRKIRGGKHG